MKHIASCSFGKDSVATILLAIENNEPLDIVLFSEVMFSHSENISGENPEHIKWIYTTAIPKLQQMGIQVEVVRAKKDYISYFSQKVIRGKRAGTIRGFPLGGRCLVNKELKVKPIKDWLKKIEGEYIQYIGIATDEPDRLDRLSGSKVSLLAKYGYTEQMAKRKCEEYELLSPIYKTTNRGGCWFCPNRSYKAFALFKQEHPELWSRLLKLGQTPNLCYYGFKYGKTIEQVDKKLNIFVNQIEIDFGQ